MRAPEEVPAALADPAKFDHDRLGHLLEDRLLMLPRFQRAYAWESSNVTEFLEDLAQARKAKREYFMGTIVLAESNDGSPRQLIVDGQQRLTTTALLLIAIRDRLRELGKDADADAIGTRFLKRYEISESEELTRLVLSPRDLPSYESLVHESNDLAPSLLRGAYELCRRHVTDIAPSATQSSELIALIAQLSDQVQILLAIASGLPEAYVIFETLNDRGADLTTADLLKNYLFSQSGTEGINYVETVWTEVAGAFEKPDDLVKFIRYEYSSRHGKVTTRKLYRALQEDIGAGSGRTKAYMKRLRETLGIFLALRDPDHPRWSSLSFDVRDSLLAFRRFGFESSMALLLAAFREWDDKRGARLVNVVASWSVRAMMAGKLGGGQSEEAFCLAAKAIAEGKAKNQNDLRKLVSEIVPSDAEFRQAFLAFGPVTTTKAKYLLGMIEKYYAQQSGSQASLADWSSKGVTIEHIIADSSDASAFSDGVEYERFQVLRNQLWNFALLERNLNKKAEDKPFAEKRSLYAKSGFPLTRSLAEAESWSLADGEGRAKFLAGLAVVAWRP